MSPLLRECGLRAIKLRPPSEGATAGFPEEFRGFQGSCRSWRSTEFDSNQDLSAGRKISRDINFLSDSVRSWPGFPASDYATPDCVRCRFSAAAVLRPRCARGGVEETEHQRKEFLPYGNLNSGGNCVYSRQNHEPQLHKMFRVKMFSLKLQTPFII